jgi:hypothetical protein
MLGMFLVLLACFILSLHVLLLAATIRGVGYGVTFLGSVAVLNKISSSDLRGDVTSSFYAVVYLAIESHPSL